MRFLAKHTHVLKNVLRSDHPKCALLSYITDPFLTDRAFHTNVRESRVLAKVIGGFGFRVDAVDYNFVGPIDYQDYELLLGFGDPMERSFDYSTELTRVCYMTGANVCYQNFAEIRRIKNVSAMTHYRLLPKRIVPWIWSRSITMADALLVVGNQWTKSTYESVTDLPVHCVNATAFINDRVVDFMRDFSRARYSFLWFGGSGLIHKGLDLCLGVFARHPDWNLHICGPKEDDFFQAFARDIERPNVRFHGLIDATSDSFAEIASRCMFAVLPTCSEGQSTALLTAMGAGLIPIATEYSGIDVQQYGFKIESLTVDALESEMEKAIETSSTELEQMSANARDHVLTSHNLASFESAIGAILSEYIQS